MSVYEDHIRAVDEAVSLTQRASGLINCGWNGPIQRAEEKLTEAIYHLRAEALMRRMVAIVEEAGYTSGNGSVEVGEYDMYYRTQDGSYSIYVQTRDEQERRAVKRLLYPFLATGGCGFDGAPEEEYWVGGHTEFGLVVVN